jgi:hypothetical protein
MITVSLAESVVETAPGPSLGRFHPSLFRPPIGKQVDKRSRHHSGARSLRLEESGRVLGHLTWGFCRVQERGCGCEAVRELRCAGCFSEGNRQRRPGFTCEAGWTLRSWTWTGEEEHRLHSAERCEEAGRGGGADAHSISLHQVPTDPICMPVTSSKRHHRSGAAATKPHVSDAIQPHCGLLRHWGMHSGVVVCPQRARSFGQDDHPLPSHCAGRPRPMHRALPREKSVGEEAPITYRPCACVCPPACVG